MNKSEAVASDKHWALFGITSSSEYSGYSGMLTKAGKKDEEGEAVVSLKQWDPLGDNKTLCIEDGIKTAILSFIF